MKQKETIWTRNYLVLFITNMVAYFGQSSLTSLLQLHADNLGISSTMIGTIIGLSYFSALCVRPFAGSIIDTANKKALFIGCELLYATSMVGLGFSTTPAMLSFFRLTYGLGNGFAGPLGLAMATDSLPERKMASGIACYTLGTVISMAVGPAVGLWIAAHISTSVAFLFAAGLTYAGAGIAFLLKYKSPKRKISFSVKGTFTKYAVVPAILSFLVSIGTSGITSFLVLYAATKGIDDVSLFYTINSAVLLFTRPMMGKISDKYGVTKIIYPTMVIFILTLFLMTKLNSLPMLYILAVIYALGYGTGYPCIQTLGMQVVPAKIRGAGTNTIYVGTDLAYLAGSVLAGALVTAVGYEKMFLITAIGPALAIVLTWFWIRKNGGVPMADNSQQ